VAHGDAADWQLPVSLPPTATYSTVVVADAGNDPAMTEATTVPPNNNDPASAVRRPLPQRIPIINTTYLEGADPRPALRED
jgi:hypothetical protein